MTWIEVASDAVKIGLGAIIATISSVLIHRYQTKTEASKSYLIKKREKLDHCVESLNSFQRLYSHYKADVFNYYYRKRNKIAPVENELSNLKIKEENFRMGFERFVDLEGYLLTIGDAKSNNLLSEYREIMKETRRDLWYEKNDIKEEFINGLDQKVSLSREKLLASIFQAYKG